MYRFTTEIAIALNSGSAERFNGNASLATEATEASRRRLSSEDGLREHCFWRCLQRRQPSSPVIGVHLRLAFLHCAQGNNMIEPRRQ